MDIRHCIHCGTDTEEGWRFCRRCGTSLDALDIAPKIAQCSNCATPIASGWRFCPTCATDASSAVELDDPGTAPQPDAPGAEQPPAHIGPDDASPVRPSPQDTLPTPGIPVGADSPAVEVSFAPAVESGQDETPEPDFAPAPGTMPQSDPVVRREPEVDPWPEALAEAETPDVTMMHEPPAPPPDPSFPMDVAASAEALRRRYGDPSEQNAGADSEASTGDSAPETSIHEPSSVLRPEVVAEDAVELISRPQAPDENESVDSMGFEPGSPSVELDEPSGDTDEPAVAIPATSQPGSGDHRQMIGTVPLPLNADERRPSPAAAPPSGSERPAGAALEGEVELPPADAWVFRNPGLFGQGVQLALLATAAVSVAMIVALTVLNNRLNDLATTDDGRIRVESAERIINVWLRPLLGLALLTTLVLAILWAIRAVRNVAVFDNPVRDTALWMWVIPVVNLFILRQHLDDAWRGSELDQGPGIDPRRGHAIRWSWAFFALSIVSIGLIAYAQTVGASTFEDAIDSNAFSMIGYAALAAALLCLVRSITAIVDRQRARVESFQ